MLGASAALLAVVIGMVVSEPKSQGATFDSIAVLPLDNFSDDPEQDYFVAGMHEALIAELAQIRALGVISRTSMNRYRNTEKSVPEIAGELDVDVVLEGSVMRAGDRVRITVQLIGAKPERHLWAETYDGDLQDVLRLHSDVASAVAREIRVAVTPEEEARLASTREVDPVVYQHYLRGRQLCVSQEESELYRGVDQHRQAISLDPTYAPAYAGMAKCYSALAAFFVPPEEVATQVQTAVNEALRLDDELAEAHAMNGHMKLFFLGDSSGGKDFERAMELDPNSVRVLMDYGRFLTAGARFDEALPLFERAVELDPLGATTVEDLGWANFVARRYDESILHLQKSLELDPEFVYGYGWLAAAYTQKGMVDEAMAAATRAETLAGDSEDQNILGVLGWVYATLGRRSEAQKILDQIGRLALRRRVDPVQLGAIYGALGELDLAMELIGESASKSSVAPFLAAHPFTDSMRSDPRFQEILRNAGLEK